MAFVSFLENDMAMGEPVRYDPFWPGYGQIGSHEDLVRRYEEVIATCAVMRTALRRMVKYEMTAKKCHETAAQVLKEVGDR